MYSLQLPHNCLSTPTHPIAAIPPRGECMSTTPSQLSLYAHPPHRCHPSQRWVYVYNSLTIVSLRPPTPSLPSLPEVSVCLQLPHKCLSTPTHPIAAIPPRGECMSTTPSQLSLELRPPTPSLPSLPEVSVCLQLPYNCLSTPTHSMAAIPPRGECMGKKAANGLRLPILSAIRLVLSTAHRGCAQTINCSRSRLIF